MNYAKLNLNEVTNGPGVRISVFVSGCHLGCKGCFNEEAQNFQYGRPFTEKTMDRILKAAKKEYCTGLSLLGGDPFAPENVDTVLWIASSFKEKFPDKTIYLWTGYTIEQLLARNSEHVIMLLKLCDVIIDGPFILEQKDLRLKLRGSRNQRILNKKDIEKILRGD